jgi:uncharacterized protein DUF6675
MKKSAQLLALMLIIITGASLCADTTIPERLLEDVREKGEMVRYFYGDLDLQYLPFGPLSEEVLRDIEGQDSTIGVEALFLIDLPEGLSANPDKDLLLFNLMNRVSTLSGIEYYSASRERMRTLFVQAYRVDKEGSTVPLEDLHYQTVPASGKQIIFQEDKTFGRNYVETEYIYKEGRFLMQVRNLTTMRYYFLPLVRPGNFRMNLLILPEGDQLLFYGVSSVDSASLFGIEKSKKDSFYNRIKAMYGWFDALIQAEYGG